MKPTEDPVIKGYIDRWAEDLTESVFCKWESEYPKWNSGFKIFYSPVISNPKLMIITLNPGGGAEDFQKENLGDYQKGNFSLPQKNEYMVIKEPPWKITEKLQEFFCEHMDLLEGSVAFPILFFRSKNIKQWRKEFSDLYSKEERKKAEEFCYTKSKEIIERINPSMLLIIGMETYDKIKKYKIILLPEKEPEEDWVGKRKERSYIENYWNEKLVFCVRHLSGAHLNKGYPTKMREKFFEIINE